MKCCEIMIRAIVDKVGAKLFRTTIMFWSGTAMVVYKECLMITCLW